MPGNIAPMALTLAVQPFNDKEWQFEIKWDGFRMLAYCSGEQVNLSSRRNNSFNKKFISIKSELQRMKLNAILDGEVVMLNEDGLPNLPTPMKTFNFPILLLRVSPKFITRALLFLDILIKAIVARGHEVYLYRQKIVQRALSMWLLKLRLSKH